MKKKSNKKVNNQNSVLAELQLGMLKPQKYDVFISYRRKTCWAIARILYERFKRKGLKVFLDSDELHIGDFRETIISNVKNCKNFVLLLSKGDLDNCTREGDWITLELSHAIKHNKPIVPIAITKDNRDCPIPEDLPKQLVSLKNAQQIVFDNTYYEATMDKIEKELKEVKWRKKFNISSRRKNDYYKSNDLSIELRRLSVLQQMEEKVDKSILKNIFAKYKKIRVISPGADDGARVMATFKDVENVEKIVMTESNEYSRKLNIKNNASSKVKIYDFSSSKKDFAKNLKTTITDGKKYNIAFICHSLYGTAKPLNIIKAMYEVLEPGGTIIIMDIDDGFEINYPDKNEYFSKLNQLRFNSPWSGNRYTGRQAFGYLKMAGFKDIKLSNTVIDNASLTHQQRWQLFEAEFSRIYNDIERLKKNYPDNEEYAENLTWLDEHCDEIEMEYLSDDFFSCLSYMVWVGTK